MMTKALSFRVDDRDIAEIKQAASMYQMSVAGLLREAVREFIENRKTAKKKKEDFFKRLENIEEASPEESAEILAMIENMTDDDWETASVKHVVLSA